MVADTLSRRVTAEAGEVDVAAAVQRAVLTVLAAVLWLLGAIPGSLVRGLVWCAVAVRVGYRDGRGLARRDGET